LQLIEVLLPVLVILIVSLSVHEAAHAWSADKLGDPTARMLGRITLNPLAHIDWIGTVLFPIIALTTGAPLLGWAKPVPVNFHNLKAPRRDFAIIAAAGPISNLLQAVVFAIVLFMLGGYSATHESVLAEIVRLGLVINVSLAVFNMIPVPPLDGGNVLAGLAPEGFARVIDQLRPYGILILYALLLTDVLKKIVEPVTSVLFGLLGLGA